MAGQMYMATEKYGQWIPCPRVNMAAGRVSWGTVSKYLGGGNYVRRSTTAAKEYSMEWGLKSRDEIRPVQDFADGFYGNGDLYFLSPFAMDKNVLPSQWAQGYLNAIDGPLVAPYPGGWPPQTYGPFNEIQRPPLVESTDSVNGFPVLSGGIRGYHSLYVPIPPGHTFHFSAHGLTPQAPGFGALSITAMNRGVPSGSPSYPGISALTEPVLNDYSYFVGDGVQHRGVLISNGTLGLDLDYTGMMAQILPNSQAPNTAQSFKSGQGHSGLQIVAPGVEYFEYSSALDKVQAAAQFVEVGSWR